MRLGLIALLCGGLVVGTTAAAAFQEQQGGAAPAQQGAAKPADKPAVDFSAPGVAKAPAGTEVRIPGLGKLGVLPKMDFGLELLYGAAGDSRPAEARPEPGEDEDLRIRGTVKHRF